MAFGLPATALAATAAAPQSQLKLTDRQVKTLDDLLFEEMGVRDLLTSKLKYGIDVASARRDLDVLNDLSLGISALYQQRPEMAAEYLRRMNGEEVREPDLKALRQKYHRFATAVLPRSVLTAPSASTISATQPTSPAVTSASPAKTPEGPAKLSTPPPAAAGFDKTFRVKPMAGAIFGQTTFFGTGARLGFNLANRAELGLDYGLGMKTGSKTMSGVTLPTVETLMRLGVSATTQPLFDYFYGGMGANLLLTEQSSGGYLDLIAGAKTPNWTLFRVQSFVVESNLGVEGRLGLNGPGSLMGFMAFEY